MMEQFDPDWLDLREPFDALARSEAVAARLVAALPARPRLLDLGAGTGSLVRWLAPRIGRAQAWTLVDADPAMASAALAVIADHAATIGLRATFPDRRTVLVHAPQGAWRIEARSADLADAPANLALDRHDAVVSSALCDLVSRAWVARMAATLRMPFYAALCVDGRDRFWPCHPQDARVAAAFRRDQGRDKGFGPALGPGAPAVIAAEFAARGFTVHQGASDWTARLRGVQPARLGARPARLATDLVLGHAAAAGAAARHAARAVDAWRHARLQDIIARRLTLRIGHRDVLALPPARSAARSAARPEARA